MQACSSCPTFSSIVMRPTKSLTRALIGKVLSLYGNIIDFDHDAKVQHRQRLMHETLNIIFFTY